MQPAPRTGGGLALNDYALVVWQRRGLVAVILLLSVAITLLTRPATPEPLYQATVTLRVQAFDLTTTGEAPITPAIDIPPAEVEAARSIEVAAETVESLRLDQTPIELLGTLTVRPQPQTNLLQLSMIDEGADTYDALLEYANRYVDFRNAQDEDRIERALVEVDERIATIERRLENVSQELASQGSVTSPETQTRYQAISALYSRYVDLREQIELDAALAGDRVAMVGSPFSQKLGAIPAGTLALIAGPVAGLLIGCALAIVLAILRPRIMGKERTEERLAYPVVATIPRLKKRRLARDPLLLQRLSGWGAEGIRMLRAELNLIEERVARLQTIVVVSPEPRDGKSTVAANLAASFAATGQRTALIHADTRARGVRRLSRRKRRADNAAPASMKFERNSAGFDEARLGAPLQAEEQDLRHVVISKLHEAAREHETIIVDTPPLLAFADALLLTTDADALVMVLRNGKTLEGRAVEALHLLSRHDAPIVGIVLNDMKAGRLDRYRYRHYYNYNARPQRRAAAAGAESTGEERTDVGDAWEAGREITAS
ncbi:MAG TPA: division plane positioning ATPase MipZ [Actinomycetota bacterium]|nr:division plane positioning ATPase MipZ [Actinomycetota bacterium]